MADHIDSVNALVRSYERVAADREKSGDSKGAASFKASATSLSALVKEVVELRKWSRPIAAEYGDISDLPEELIAQLSGVKTDELEDQIYAVVKASGDSIEMDRLLIELYRRSRIVHERRFITNKCYRMAQKGLIHAVPGRKGVYTVHIKGDTQKDAPPTGPASPSSGPKNHFPADLDDEIPF